MKDSPKTIEIDDVEYVEKSRYTKASQSEGLDFVIIRTYSAGVFAGYLKRRDGKEVELVNAIRLWYWDGAFTLSQLATEGTNKASNCQFGVPINVILTEAIEIIECSEEAKENILSVKPTKK